MTRSIVGPRATRRTFIGMMTAIAAMLPVAAGGRRTAAATEATPASAAGADYTIAELPGIGGFSGSADAINEAGVIAGTVTTPLVDGEVSRAVRWVDGVPTVLETLGGASSWALGINNDGTVVGLATTAESTVHACAWDAAGRVTDLDPFGGSLSMASAINDAGEIVGLAETPGAETRPIHWTGGEAAVLRALGAGTNGVASGISEGGLIVGWEDDPVAGSGYRRTVRAVRWRDGVPEALLGSASMESVSQDVNTRGEIAGYTWPTRDDENTAETGFVWFDGEIMAIPALGGASCKPVAINERGWVVGAAALAPADGADDAPAHAFLWRDGQITDLGTLGGEESEAFGINEAGVIVGAAATAAGDAVPAVWRAGAGSAITPVAPAVARVELPEPIATLPDEVRVQILADGTLYGGGGNAVMAVNAATGEPRWQRSYAVSQVGVETLVDNLLVVRAFDLPAIGTANPGMTLEALDAATGESRWSLHWDELASVAGTLEGAILVDNGPLSPFAPVSAESTTAGLCAVDARTGTIRWRRAEATDAFVMEDDAPGVYAMLAGTGGYDLAALDPADGNVRWRAPLPASMGYGPRSVDAERLFGHDDDLWAIERATGRELWRTPVAGGSVVDVLAIPAQGVVVVATYDAEQYESALAGFDAVTGVERWRTLLQGWLHGSSTLVGDTVVIGNQDDPLFGGPNAAVFGIDPASGELRWRAVLGATWTGVGTADGRTAYVLARNHNLDYERLIALDAASGEIRWKLAIGGGSDVRLLGDRLYLSGPVLDETRRSAAGVAPDALVAIETETGRIAWRIATSPE